MTNGIIPLYHRFIRSLRNENKELARLQALGRIEEYFTKRFASCIYRESEMSVLPLTKSEVLDCATQQGLWWHDYKRPYLREVYMDEEVTILKRKFYATLYHGIWRLGD